MLALERDGEAVLAFERAVACEPDMHTERRMTSGCMLWKIGCMCMICMPPFCICWESITVS